VQIGEIVSADVCPTVRLSLSASRKTCGPRFLSGLPHIKAAAAAAS